MKYKISKTGNNQFANRMSAATGLDVWRVPDEKKKGRD